MNANNAIRDIMKNKGVKPSDLASRLGIERNALYGRLTQENISTNKLGEMLNALGFKLAILPIGSKIPNDGYDLIGPGDFNGSTRKNSDGNAGNDPFRDFLESIGYAVSFVPAEKQGDDLAVKLSRGKTSVVLSLAEFENFSQETKQSIDYQFWQKSHA